MVDDVEWPDVANDTVLRGKEAVRHYWEAQLTVASPQVTPPGSLRLGTTWSRSSISGCWTNRAGS